MNQKEKERFTEVISQYGDTCKELGRLQAQTNNLERQGLGFSIALALGILIGLMVR